LHLEKSSLKNPYVRTTAERLALCPCGTLAGAERDHAALTELGTIPALFAGTGLCVVYPSFRVHVADCRHGDVRSWAVLGGVFLVYGLEEEIVTSPRAYANGNLTFRKIS
jgi:hypothetical protein